MSIINDFISRFRSKAPLEAKINELEEQLADTAEKILDFSMALPGVDDGGNMVYYNTSSLNKAFSTNYVINRCINILAYNLSKLPFRVYRNGKPMPLDFVLPGGFNILQPHPRMSLSKLLYECGVYYWYKGEFMSLIDEDTRLSLEPINPAMMKIGASEGRSVTSWRFNNSENIPSDELIYSSMMNPESTYTAGITDSDRTLSPVKVVEKELTNYISGREFNVQFFQNFAQLGLTLTDVNGRTSKEDRKAIVDQIDNKLSRGKAWKTRVLPQGLDVAKSKDMSMREMEFSKSLKDIRDIILGIYGVPRSVFGITNEAGLAQSTVETEERIMWNGTIQPAAHMIQEAFNQTLMRKYFPVYRLKFDYTAVKVLQDNMIEKTELAAKYQALGYTTEEINAKLDLGMEETADARMQERFHPSVLLPYSEIEADLMDNSKSTAADDAINKIAELAELEETKSVSQQRYRNSFNRIQRKTEKAMAGKLGRYFAEQLGKVLGIVKEEKMVKAVDTALLLSKLMNLMNDEKKVLVEATQPIYENASLAGSKLALGVLKIDAPPAASEMVVKALTNEVANINNYTYKLLTKQIKESVNAGESVAMMTKRIQGIYKFNKSRARTIARTESLKVVSRSTDEEYKKAGVKMKRWLSSPGARSSHAACSAQGKIPYDDAFSNGLMFPGDSGPASEIINCRCSLAPVIE